MVPHVAPLTEEELQLHAQYNRLCAEKRRMLSAIDAANKECRVLTHLIHRLLDFVAELAYSDEDYDEDQDDIGAAPLTHISPNEDCLSAVDGEWLAEADPEDNAIEQQYEAATTNALRIRLGSAHVNHRTSFKTFSRSPSPNKSHRDYKNLPVRDNGALNLPVILGRGVHRTVLLQTGQVVNSPAFRRGEYIFPLGLQIRRKYYDFDSDVADIKSGLKRYYQCSVKSTDGGMAPLFEISSTSIQSGTDDGRGTAASTTADYCDQDTNLDALWDRFRQKFTPEGQSRLLDDFGLPELFFGLNHDSLAKFIRDQSDAMNNSLS